MKCTQCHNEVKPLPSGYVAKTCSPECLAKARSNNASKAIKQGRIKSFSLADRKR